MPLRVPVSSARHFIRHMTTEAATAAPAAVTPRSALTVQPPTDLETSKFDIIDTHCHLHHTFEMHHERYREELRFKDTTDLVNQVYPTQNVRGVVDVWCECPPRVELLDELRNTLGSIEDFSYNYVIGVHPESAQKYTSEVEEALAKEYSHPRCVGWGEIGLDYHYLTSPKDLQHAALRSQLRKMQSLGLDKALTIHTREADDDIYAILTEEVPKDKRIHIHCFTDTPELAQKLLDHFPNLFIGVTGVATYSSNPNTQATVRNIARTVDVLQERAKTEGPSALRILLETDSPYMIPGNMDRSKKKKRTKDGTSLKVSHSAMIPYTCQFIASKLNEDLPEGQEKWTTLDILDIGRRNAKFVYGV